MPQPKRVRPKPGQLVLVRWIDAVEDECGWHEMEGYRLALKRVQSVGWVHVYSKDIITLYACQADEGDFGRILSIPGRMVANITILETEDCDDED